MADTDYISVRRLRTFLAQMKQWVLGFTANRNTQAMSDVTKDTGISGTVAIGKSITIHTASGAQTANVMNADMITNTEPSSNKDKVTKAPTYDLMENTVMTAISDAFDDITTIEYQVINNASQLPATGTNGVIYLAAIYSEVENPTGNPHDLGYFVREDESDESDDGIVTYVLTTDTSVQSGTTYYKKEDAYDEYIWLTPENRYEKLGQASIDISGLKFAGSATSGGSAYKTGAIPFGRVDSTSTATNIKATVEGIDRLEDGTCVMLRNNVVTSAAGFTININGLGAHPSFNNMTNTTRDTTIFNINYTMLFVYDAEREVDGVTGAWCCYRGYNSNDNTIGYQVRTNSSTLPAKFKTYRYRLLFTSADGNYFVAANASTSTNATSKRTPTSEKIDPFGPIVYYGTTTAVSANSNFATANLWEQYTLTLGYSFNHTNAALVLSYPKPVYVKCAPQSDGSVKIYGSDTVASYTQALPTTEDGLVYIFLGIAYSATAIELRLEHPVYYFKDGAIRLWTNQADAEVEIKKYNYDRDESDEGTADYGQTDIIVNGDTSTIISTQAPPSAVRQYIAPSWRAMNQKLAEKADADDVPHNLHVTLTSSTSGNTTTYTADHTHAEITAALATGGIVDVEHESYLYDFDGDVDGEIYFRRVTTQSVSGGASDNVYEHLFLVRVVNDEDKWTKESDNPIISNASTSRTGVVQLNDAVNSNSTTQAATANAVKKVKDAIPTKTSDLNNDSGFITSHQDISGKVDYADGTKTYSTQTMGTTTTTIGGVDMYTSGNTTYTIANGMTIQIDAQDTTPGYIYQNSNSTILAQDPSGDVEWTNTTGESVVVKIGSATSGENYSITIFKKGYYTTIDELTEKIEEAAASGVQADWDESDADDPAYIKNKPTVYTKPLSGIPKGDLSNAVQTSLGKADSAVQSVTISQSSAVGTGGTTIQVDNGNIYKVVSDGEPQGSDSGYVAPTWGAMKTLLSDKVDKVSGKGLSTNDYTTEEKTKLGGISEGAEANVQSNWNETDNSSDAFIQNKPTIPTALADLTEDSSHKVVSQASITTWNGKAEKVTQVNHGTSDTTYTLTPNVLHVWGEVTALTLTLGTGESGVVSEYMFQFYSGNTPTTLTLPNSVIWVQPLTTQAGKTYQVSIVNNLAAYITDGMAAAESSGGTPTYATQAWVTALIDSVPTANSSNVPSSGGTYAAIEGGYYYS